MLERQSTSVPNTSKNNAFTSDMSSLSWDSGAGFTLQRGKLHAIVKERNGRQ